MTVKLNETQIQKVNELISLNTPITYIADKMGVNYKTMKRILKKDFNDYKGNQAGKGISKIKSNTPSIQDYLDGTR